MAKHKYTALILAILAFSLPFATLGYSPMWEKSYDGGKNDYANSVVCDYQDNIIVTGSTYQKSWDYVTIKYDKNGNVLWQNVEQEDGTQEAHDVAVDKQNNVYVTGISSGRFYTVKYSSDGKKQWAEKFNMGSNDSGEGVATDSKGNVIVVGHSLITNQYDVYTVKYDKNGKMVWKVVYQDAHDDFAYDVVVDAYDNIIVAGMTMGTSRVDTENSFMVLKYNKDGKLLWRAQYDGKQAHGMGVALDFEGNVIIAGYVHNGNDFDYKTVKFNKDGKLLWHKSYNAGKDDKAYAIAVDKKDNIAITGSSYKGGALYFDYLTVIYDKSGKQIWEQRQEIGEDDQANGVAFDSRGNVVVTGSVRLKSWEFHTIKYRN
ncbi:MAG: Beta-propeller repeat protein [Candidatus Methanofastidiosum methylothiophilum]|jgi:uncharacterized delta-60 repeat protein|uniref:Beta-propeller repeat protein n=1 Tax=Candidatus Methanofastidiosum methylothiophilum TaxID=1705564 RepID=A0A150IN88_9EURY|nr:MAG: Beta-propeller repeat protein [Candidatus Methanofastidiosum methylthiophilus]NMC76724.1 PQQ-binding-like beta-propeller repeat protein [Candidatus Methanofastidiosa archaeon]